MECFLKKDFETRVIFSSVRNYTTVPVINWHHTTDKKIMHGVADDVDSSRMSQ
jgi:hypothetical protein